MDVIKVTGLRKNYGKRSVLKGLDDQPAFRTENRFEMERFPAYRDRHEFIVSRCAQRKATGFDSRYIVTPTYRIGFLSE